MSASAAVISPEILGFWVRCMRHSTNWSQDALAAASGVTERTIQRLERGERSSISTRRSVARGLGYEDHNIFDDPDFAEKVHNIFADVRQANEKAIRDSYPDRIPVTVTPVASGSDLANIVDQAGASLFHCSPDAPRSAQESAAALFDLMRDLIDVWDDIPFSDRLNYSDEFERQKLEIESHGMRVYSALRHTKIKGENWKDKIPLPMTIGYLAILPMELEITQIMVPKRLS